MSRKVRLLGLTEEILRKAPRWLAHLYPEQFPDIDNLSVEDTRALDSHMRRLIAHQDSEYYAVEMGGEVAAIIGFQEINWLERSAMMFLAIDPDAKGKKKGDGRKVMKWLQDVLVDTKSEKKRFAVLRAFCFDRDMVASNMLRKCGFNEVPLEGKMMEFRANG